MYEVIRSKAVDSSSRFVETKLYNSQGKEGSIGDVFVETIA